MRDGQSVTCGGFAGTQCPRDSDQCEFYQGSDYGPCCRKMGNELVLFYSELN